MREVKFRAWYEKEKRFLSWDELQDGTESLQTYFNNELSDVSPLMQYTGLKDKNGKEIYEGDILEVESFEGRKSIVRVVFDDGCFCHIGYLGDLRTYPLRDLLFNGSKAQIIGNIYNHPHLLEGEE